MPYRHPSGPELPGHVICGKGMIYDHGAHRCISLVSYKKKHGSAEKKKTLVHGVS